MFVPVWLALVLSFIASVYLWLRKNYSYWSDRNVPHKKPLFFWGNMKGLGKTVSFADIDRRIYNRFKGQGAPFVGFYAFMTKQAFIMDLDLIKHILIKDFDVFPNRDFFHNVVDDPLTSTLVLLDGEPWRVLRHKLSPVFTSGRIRDMLPSVLGVGEQLVLACNKIVEQRSGSIEAKDLSALYTTDVIGSIAFGLECNSLRDPNAEFRRMFRLLRAKPRHNGLVTTFMYTETELARRLHMKMYRDDVSAFFIKAVSDTMEYRLKNNIKRNDFMDKLIELKLKRDKLEMEGKLDLANDQLNLDNGLTLEQAAAQAFAFFLGGFDTTSTTMSFCIYELALNPKIQTKLRAEIEQVIRKHDNQLTYEAINEMTYLDMVIQETLRKYALAHLFRKSVAPYRVPGTDHVFPAGMRIMIPVDSIHYDPEYYPEPEVFDPERFTPEACSKRHPCAFLPFGDGPRNCIGLRFGKLQTKIGVISVVRHFKISTNERTQIPMEYNKNNFAYGGHGGIHLTIEKV